MKNFTKKNFCKRILLALLICLITACSKEPLEQEIMLDVSNLQMKDPDIIEGHYIVIVSEEPTAKNSKAASHLKELSEKIAQMPNARLNRKYNKVLTGFAAELTQEQVKTLRKDPRIKSIVQDSYVYLFNDPVTQEFPTWGLDRTNQRDSQLDRIYSYTATGTGINVYILDSGIRYSHQEFGGRAKLGYDFTLEDDPANTDPNQQPGEDCMGHGTHVAGTVGGKVYGVAKDVNLISVRVFGCERKETPQSRVLAAVEWITTNAVHPAIVNMSLGYESDSDVITTAVQNSIQTGIHYSIAAGNSNNNACLITPARTSEAITVGATEIGDKRAFFSSFGDCVDLYAPGYRVTSASHLDDNATVVYSGTSMAAPHVAGVVALYLQNYPEATPATVHSAIVDNSTPQAVSEVPEGNNNFIYSLWEPATTTPPLLKITATGNKLKGKQVIDLTWESLPNDNVKIFRDGQLIAEGVFNGYYRDNTEISGNDATYVHYVCQTAPFYQELCSSEVTTIFGNGGTTTEPTNSPPTAGFIYTTDLLNVQYTDTSTDSDGSLVAWSWNFGDGYTSTEKNPYHSYSAAGAYTVTLTVTDDAGATANSSQNISVKTEESSTGAIVLTATGYKEQGKWRADLSWTPAGTSAKVDVYRNGSFLRSVENTGSYKDVTNLKGGGTLTYKICEAGTTTCSNEVTVQY